MKVHFLKMKVRTFFENGVAGNGRIHGFFKLLIHIKIPFLSRKVRYTTASCLFTMSVNGGRRLLFVCHKKLDFFLIVLFRISAFVTKTNVFKCPFLLKVKHSHKYLTNSQNKNSRAECDIRTHSDRTKIRFAPLHLMSCFIVHAYIVHSHWSLQ